MYDCIIVRTKKLNLPHLPVLPLPVTAKQRLVIIPRDQLDERINDNGGNDFEKSLKGNF